MVFFFAFGTFSSTLLGGLLGLRYRDRLHVILGFTAGVLVAVVALDILSEMFDLLRELDLPPFPPMIALVGGFLLFHVAESALLIHHAHEDSYVAHHHPAVGVLSALALSGHSFLDGVGIGLGFQVSTAVGTLVAVAVMAHDFCDGLNTVSLTLVHHHTPRRTFGLLLLDAFAPIAGALSTLFFTLSRRFLPLYLGFFAGFLLYMGASDILPEAHRGKHSWKPLAATIGGIIFIFAVVQII